MAISISTSSPSNLLASFKKAIDDGHISTWECDKDGDFTHNVDQWRNKAWLRPRLEAGQLVLNIIHPQGVTISKVVYAVYHGRFIESMLTHCDSIFSISQATALPTASDKVS